MMYDVNKVEKTVETYCDCWIGSGCCEKNNGLWVRQLKKIQSHAHILCWHYWHVETLRLSREFFQHTQRCLGNSSGLFLGRAREGHCVSRHNLLQEACGKLLFELYWSVWLQSMCRCWCLVRRTALTELLFLVDRRWWLLGGTKLHKVWVNARCK